MEPARDIRRLVEVMAALRTPVTGCPWDLEQTFASIAPYTIEEAYEVADAIERGDMADLKEELGDLLLQVVYHSRLAEEQGAFDLGDVVHGITRKMIRRHPHVFGDERGATSDEAKASWERIKAEEKSERAAERARLAAGATERSAATDVPARPVSTLLGDAAAALPALTLALRIQDKAAAVGFDWYSLAPVLDKVREELAELEEVALAADPRGAHAAAPDETSFASDKSRIEEELGDLLFVMANVARHLGVHPESALRRANAKFVRRFGAIERKLAERGKTPAESDLSEMDALWNEAKREE
ncbi:MAG: nucleoside triphosphate pyrophosphohydrolase [Hyphomicrobiaceae bacterium]|nr:nucleoside triphosphate pyrophosphohydrolase [Hyphomicrobiaceae bacterium]